MCQLKIKIKKINLVNVRKKSSTIYDILDKPGGHYTQ
jgi:hypothetical protein